MSQGTILHVLDHSFPVADGYAFRSGEIIRNTRALGWDTIHLTSSKQGRSAAAIETVDGLEFQRTQPSARVWHRLPVLSQWAVVATLRARLEALVAGRPVSLVHVHSPCLNGLAALPVARRAGIPLIYEIRSLWEDAAVDAGACREGDLRYRVSRALETRVCRQADRIVAICDGLRGEIVGRGIDADRVAIVPNSVDLARFSRAGARDEALAAGLGLPAGKTIGFIGTFFPFEGLDIFVRAVPALLEAMPAVRVLLVGDGPEDARLRALARSLGVADRIVFAGRVPHAQIERYYDLIDVLVYPRISARLTDLVTPLKPLEAMAQRKLVVASDVGGHREMLRDGWNGHLFTAGDPAALADACARMLRETTSWEIYRDNGRRYVQEERSWSVNARRYDVLYRQLLGIGEMAA